MNYIIYKNPYQDLNETWFVFTNKSMFFALADNGLMCETDDLVFFTLRLKHPFDLRSENSVS